ncbi:hypothetical protein [Methylobacterium dankookense]|uniref:Uncharacterized protein n=1 Tax=Methylobacterium dankookense TaxID=560405 RepID=A0A564FWZ0_9HYPH|nr:hypothetical protein [Methylobacterium dankookense]VUF12220.1 hypothetical protein MTDSW087_01909 [Methylobacterium dankookense]
MPWPSPHPADLRAEAERRLRETAEPMTAIAAALGIPRGTLTTWNARGGWRKPRPSKLSPATWPLSRREAIARLYYEPRNHPQDIAEALGIGRMSAGAFFKAAGLTLRRGGPAAGPPPPLDAAGAADGASLRAALRGHIARQIAGFDAALTGGGAAVVDSARVLRDLGGLKKLLDELGTAEERDDGAGRDDADLPALRAEIARRLGLAPPRRDAGPAAADPGSGARP